MLINGNGNLYINSRNNSCGTKLFKLPIKKLNIQSRNTNNNINLTKNYELKKKIVYIQQKKQHQEKNTIKY